MALPILDGNQSATTLSTILSSGQHITAHTVISLGTQAITDITSAISGTSVCVGSISISGTPSVTGSVSVLNFPASQSTTFGAVTGSVSVLNFPASQSVTFGATTGSISVLNFPASQAVTFSAVSISNFPSTQPVSIASVTIGNTVTIAGTVTANVTTKSFLDGLVAFAADQTPLLVELYNPIPAGTNRIGVVTIGAGTVTIGAGTAQIGSVTASISGTVPISISSVTVGNSLTIASLPALAAGTAQIGSVTASISNSVTIGSLPLISGTVTANTFALQGTAVTTSDFTSTTASTLLAGFNAGREVLTIFSEGPGTLFVCPGATCTTIAYQVRLSSGDYYEVPNHQTTITHSAVFATAGTARVTEVS